MSRQRLRPTACEAVALDHEQAGSYALSVANSQRVTISMSEGDRQTLLGIQQVNGTPMATTWVEAITEWLDRNPRRKEQGEDAADGGPMPRRPFSARRMPPADRSQHNMHTTLPSELALAVGFEAEDRGWEVSPVHRAILTEYFNGEGLRGAKLASRRRLVRAAREAAKAAA